MSDCLCVKNSYSMNHVQIPWVILRFSSEHLCPNTLNSSPMSSNRSMTAALKQNMSFQQQDIAGYFLGGLALSIWGVGKDWKLQLPQGIGQGSMVVSTFFGSKTCFLIQELQKHHVSLPQWLLEIEHCFTLRGLAKLKQYKAGTGALHHIVPMHTGKIGRQWWTNRLCAGMTGVWNMSQKIVYVEIWIHL